MIAVIFEATTVLGERGTYLDLAKQLWPKLEKTDGFISIERFESLTLPGKILSLSFWRDEDAMERWRNLDNPRAPQSAGGNFVFGDYRLRIAHVLRDHGLADRRQAPSDDGLARM